MLLFNRMWHRIGLTNILLTSKAVVILVRNCLALLKEVTEAKLERSLDVRSCRTAASHSHPTLSITTPSPPSQTYFTDPPLHLTLTARDTFFLTKYCCQLICKPSFPLLLISFTLFTFRAHPAGLSFCNFTGLLPFLRLLTSTTATA